MVMINRTLISFHQFSWRYFSSVPSSISTKLHSEMKKLIDSQKYQNALELFHRQFQNSTDPTVTLALKASAILRDYQSGTRIHRQLSERSTKNPWIQSSLIHFYMQCNDVSNAEKVFSSIETKTVFMYGAMFKGYINNGRSEKVIELFKTSSVQPDQVMILLLFNACAKHVDENSIKLGTNVLNQLSTNVLTDPKLINASIDMLMKFQHVQRAERLFQSMKNKNLLMHRIMMQGYLDNSMPEKSLNLFEKIHEKPDEISYRIAFDACGTLRNQWAVDFGNKLLRQLPTIYKTNVFLVGSILKMLIQFGQLKDAEEFFHSVTKKTIVTYGTMIKGYIDHGLFDKAFDLHENMTEKSDDIFNSIMINACVNSNDQRAIRLATKIFYQLWKNHKSHSILGCSIVKMLMKFGQVKEAENVFKCLKKNDVISYGAMMKGYVDNNLPEKVFDLFQEISNDADQVIFTLVFTACAASSSQRAIQLGNQLLQQISIKKEENIVLITSAINMLMKFGQIKQAEELFSSSINKDTVIWSAMIKGYVENGLPDKALDLFEQTSENSDEKILISIFSACAALSNQRAIQLGNQLLHRISTKKEANIILISSAINMLMKFGQMKKAEDMFAQVKKLDAAIYGTMMHGYNLNDRPQLSLKLFDQMKQQEIKPNLILFLALIHAAALIGMRPICENIVNQILPEYQNDHQLKNALIDMWGKALAVEEAIKVFQSISQPDTISYNTMINAYGRTGMGLEAVNLYCSMSETLKDHVSHVCVLNACSHSGLVDQARTIYNKINVKTEKIVTAMVDCLSRMFIFDEALNLIDEYELSHSPLPIMYTALLSGVRSARQSDLAQTIYNRMEKLFSNHRSDLISASILLSNTYGSIGDYQQANDIRDRRLKSYGEKTEVGLTWTVINGKVWEFKAHDTSNPHSSKIYAKLDEILRKLQEHGYKPDQSWITRPLQNDETPESVLCGHSERIAIAFNLIQEPQPNIMYLTKNLRICPDCHHVSKLIAQIYQCEIIARDANRGHHFYRNGQCSCSDHF